MVTVSNSTSSQQVYIHLPGHGIRYTKARDTTHALHGIRYTGTGYDTLDSRDTVHAFDGMRYTGFTGYDTPEKPSLWLETLIQQGFQESAKNH